MRLTLDETVAAEIAAHGEHGYPHEVCGLLLGRFANDGERIAMESFRLENERIDHRENRYAVSGRSMLEAERYARSSGFDVVGYYHSHPDAPAVPSAFDLDHATWPGVSYPIVSVRDGVAAAFRSWTLTDDRSAFVEEPLRIMGVGTGATDPATFEKER